MGPNDDLDIIWAIGSKISLFFLFFGLTNYCIRSSLDTTFEISRGMGGSCEKGPKRRFSCCLGHW